MNDDLILGLDPSSTVIGYAFKQANKVGPEGLVEAGLIKPDTKQLGEPESFWRIIDMCKLIESLLLEYIPRTILVEWTKGKVGKRRHHGNGAGLAVYGCGVGGIGMYVYKYSFDLKARFVPILENDWTRGVPKKNRQAAIASEYQQYDPAADPGGDIADAIGLVDWWLREQLVK